MARIKERQVVKVESDVEVDLICDMCEESCFFPGDEKIMDEVEYATLKWNWGECAIRYGAEGEYELCEDCWADIMAYIKERRERNLPQETIKEASSSLSKHLKNNMNVMCIGIKANNVVEYNKNPERFVAKVTKDSLVVYTRKKPSTAEESLCTWHGYDVSWFKSGEMKLC